MLARGDRSLNCYVVAAEVPEDRVAKAYPDHHYRVSDRVWVVAGDQATCSDVCTTLGIWPNQSRGTVFKFQEYYGFYDRALWDKIAIWQRTG